MPSSIASSLATHEDEAVLTLAYLRERDLLRPLLVLLGSFFLAYVNVGTPYPFLADALDDKGVDSTSVGAAYAMHPIGIAFAQLFTAPLERRYGTVKMHSAGFLLAGTCTLLMAFAFDITTDPTMLAGLVIGVRFLQGLGEGFIDNAVISMYQLNFSEVVGKVMGLSEGAIGLGLAAGPLLGGVLYKAGGTRLAFGVVAVPFFVLAVVCPLLLRGTKTKQDVGSVVVDEGPLVKPHSDALVGVVSLGIFVVNFGYGSLTPLLPVYIDDEFGWDEVVAGGVFAGAGVVYFIAGLICGHLSDQNSRQLRPSIYPFLVGSLISGISYIGTGPFPGLHVSKDISKSGILIGVQLAMIGQAFATIFGVGVLTVAARSHSLASSAYNAAVNLGMGLGPIVGTILKDQFGFRWAMAVNVFLGFSVVLFTPLAVSRMQVLFSHPEEDDLPEDGAKLLHTMGESTDSIFTYGSTGMQPKSLVHM